MWRIVEDIWGIPELRRGHIGTAMGCRPGGHNSYQECRYCNIRGIWSNHIYYPTTSPNNFENNTTYDIFALPNRTHEEWQQRLEKIHKSKVGKM
ncbi:hypothetical protein RhiirA5_440124 [Rhizophagus irregularis]|uniref:Uncharacterized protein n=1 Tax=Rhizophagus irregularis TaxID=588596 RepID=A0A2N0NH29_9GLOM|nr:hypothetical protein RhiirA5_440124 [Rhizophagus irregularis]